VPIAPSRMRIRCCIAPQTPKGGVFEISFELFDITFLLIAKIQWHKAFFTLLYFLQDFYQHTVPDGTKKT
jgi:hypothetical protein